MKISKTNFEGLLMIERNRFNDKRGALTKFFSTQLFEKLNFQVDDIYTTKSLSRVVRGLHHQRDCFGQAKLVSCLSGSFVDIAVDLRRDSATFKKIFHHVLDSNNCESILVPEGFSHGTFALEDETVMLSICSGKYLPEHESGININSLNLPYDLNNAIISDKDIILPNLNDF